MPAFEYKALDASGRATKGLITADSELAARRELRNRALAPMQIARTDRREPVAGTDHHEESFLDRIRRRELSSRELMLVTRQLAILIDAGMPIAEAVGLVGSQLDKHHMRRILLSVRAKVTEGERLSDALAAYPKSFPSVYRALIAAGEGAGGLGAVMNNLADHLEKEQTVRTRITGAMIYPAVLATVAIGVVTLLMLFVVPKLAEQFAGMGVTMPMLTQIMIGISAFLQMSWPFLLAVIVLGGAGLTAALSQEPIRRPFDALTSRLLFLGGFLRKIEAARFARTMAILISSGAVLPDGLRAARRAAGNLAFKDRVEKIINDVETGRSLSDALKASGWFPALLLYMVAAGERSGRLDEMFRRSADQLDQDVDSAITIGLNLLEPGIILLLGIVVVLIVLSILLPILQMNTLVLG